MRYIRFVLCLITLSVWTYDTMSLSVEAHPVGVFPLIKSVHATLDRTHLEASGRRRATIQLQ
jgi:hypothetical protein